MSSPALPTGTVTFLFTDVEGSTRLWEQFPAQMRAALIRHDALIESLTATHHGQVVRPRGEGDSRFCVFPRASDAVAAAGAIQSALHQEPWPLETPIKIRVAVHTGEADLRDGDYYGSAVNRAARIRALAHGGQTLLSQATHDLVQDALPPHLSLKDLGEHRLKDLGRSERIFQLLPQDLTDTFPPLKSLDTLPNNLPLQVTSFVGREKEMAEVTRLLAASRLLTLTGAGGSGKTRLALQAAAHALDDRPDGVWLVELAPLSEPAHVAAALAGALSVREEPGVPLPDTLCASLHAKNLLIVLDNCEHLIAACAALADRLIRACPGVHLLCTSREALGIAGETTWRVPSLGLPDSLTIPGAPEDLAATLSQYEAVRLFIDRAVAVVPTFAVTNQNAPTVAQVCHRLDGIPLAIELAAARLRGLSVEQLAARLDQRFRLLTGGSRTALPRQQTLQAAVDWSYGLLDEREKTLFNRLSVFSGGWTLEAAEAVCTGPTPGGEPIEDVDVLDLLLRLVDKSLVVTHATDAGVDRYRLLETLRQYGREKLLATGEAEAIHLRHAEYFLRTAEADVQGRTAYANVLAWFAREHDNVRAALQWFQDTGDVERGLTLGAIAGNAWVYLCHFEEGRRRLRDLLCLPGAERPTAHRVRAVLALAGLARRQAEYDVARPLFEEALTIARELSVPSLLARSLMAMANFTMIVAEHAASRAYLDEVDAVARAHNLPFSTVFHRGQNALHEGDLAAARTYFERTIERARSFGGTPAYPLRALGLVALDEGKLDEAGACFGESLRISHAQKDLTHFSMGLDGFAALATRRGDPHHGMRLHGAAAGVRQRIGAPLGPAWGRITARQVQEAATLLGEPAATEAFQYGHALTADHALALALQPAKDPVRA